MNSLLLMYVVILLVVLAVVIVAGLNRRNQQIKKRQIIGISWLQSLRKLLSHIQQHRGLTNGYLNGGKELINDIYPLQKMITADIDAIVRIDGWIESSERWGSITQHWARLAGGFESNNCDNNLIQHNNLIQNLLYLIDDMAQAHDLLLLKDSGGKPFHLSWRELLSAAEYIGQARAIGTGVAALHCCDSISRIRLNYLCQKITENTSRVWRDIPPSDEQRKRVDELLLCINEKIIRDHTAIAATEYFDIASKALNSLHDQYDTLIEARRWQ